ncbi:MAG: hypothetical protein K2Z81_08165, partial [Cyanobacteria bacterium]|nr:hypothetical protein [Cyanobacteriota bacterium]
GLFDIDYTPSRDYVLNVVGNQVEYGKSLRCAYLTPSTSACQDWRADLRYAGSSEVVNKTLEANLPKGKCRSGVVQISPDGRWAVIQVSNDEQSRLYLVDGKERKTSLLSNLPDTHLNWLQ